MAAGRAAVLIDSRCAPPRPFDRGNLDKAPKEIVAKWWTDFRPIAEKRPATAKTFAAELGARVDERYRIRLIRNRPGGCSRK